VEHWVHWEVPHIEVQDCTEVADIQHSVYQVKLEEQVVAHQDSDSKVTMDTSGKTLMDYQEAVSLWVLQVVTCTLAATVGRDKNNKEPAFPSSHPAPGVFHVPAKRSEHNQQTRTGHLQQVPVPWLPWIPHLWPKEVPPEERERIASATSSKELIVMKA